MGLFGASKKKTETIANLEAKVLRLQAALSDHAATAAVASTRNTAFCTPFNSSDTNSPRARDLQQQVDQLRREKAQLHEELRRSNGAASDAQQHLHNAYQQMDALWAAQRDELQMMRAENDRKTAALQRANAERVEGREDVINTLIVRCNELTAENKNLVTAAKTMANESRIQNDAFGQEKGRLEEAVGSMIHEVYLGRQALREQTVTLTEKETDLREAERELEASKTQQRRLSQQLEEQQSVLHMLQTSRAETARNLEEAARELEVTAAEKRHLSQQLEEQESERQSVVLERNRIRMDLGASQRLLEDSKKEARMKDAKLEFLQQLVVAKNHGLPGPPAKPEGFLLKTRSPNSAVVYRQVSTPVLRGQDGTNGTMVARLPSISESSD